MIQIVNHSDLSSRKVRYAIETLLNISGVSLGNNIRIAYGIKFPLDCDIVITGLETGDLDNFGGEVINEDIVLKSFQLLSAEEEYHSPKDQRGRFLAEYSQKNNSLPYVNHYASLLKAAVERAAAKKKIQIQKFDRQFTVLLSHDVDSITEKNIWVQLHRLVIAWGFLKRKQSKKFLSQILFFLTRIISFNNPYWNFSEYMNLEDAFGYRSSFYFMNGDGGRLGARYRLETVKAVIRELIRGGWEVGLHTNYFSYNQVEMIKKEKEAIERITDGQISGNRNHYLRFEPPTTWNVLAEAGFRYDSTFGYSDAIGFRGGVAFPFYPYDLEADEPVNILEIPLVIMDGSILNEEEENYEQAWVEIRKILDKAKEVNGVIAVNFHQRIFFDREYKGWKEVYQRILTYIRDNQGRGLTGHQIYQETIAENNYDLFSSQS